VRLIGDLAGFAERVTRKLLPPLAAGVLCWLVVVLAVGGAGWGLLELARLAGPLVHWVAGFVVVYVTISARDLATHAHRVSDRLATEDLAGARVAVGMMVSRETGALDAEGVVRATVESVSENTSDAVFGALFYAAFFGPIGALVYRAVNTMDAMFGYRTERYLLFGRLAARADDLANYLPARLCGLAICLAGVTRRRIGESLRLMRRDARKHASPNAGFPEAATAAVLGVRLGGPSVYFGRVEEKPWIGPGERTLEAADIRRATRLMWISSGVATLVAALARFVVAALV
jgi:adenosylcobinamide-phosphate synthase